MTLKDFNSIAEKIGVGKKCLVSIDGKVINDAKLQKEKENWYVCQNEKAGSPCADKLNYEYSWVVYNDTEASDIDYIRPTEKRLEYGYCEIGDIIVDKVGGERMILDVREKVLVVSGVSNFDYVMGVVTYKELNNLGYTIKQDNPENDIVEVTLETLKQLYSDGHHVPVDKLRIKE
jgi:hypothetical protein